MGRTQSPLCLLNFPPKFLNGPLVGAKVFSGLLLEDLDEMLHDTLVKVFTSEVGVSVGGNDLEDSVGDGQEGDVEGSSSQIEDENVLFSGRLVVQAVSDGSGRRLVDDSDDVET